MKATLALERILQSQGFGSRKECRQIIRDGRVLVAGEMIDDPSAELAVDGLNFEVDGEAWNYHDRVYVMIHKPSGYECSRAPKHHPSVLSLLPPPLVKRGVQTVGRLDEDTSGLLLCTDDGEFIHRLISPKYKVPKVYSVTTKHPIADAQLAALQQGVLLHDAPEPVAAHACRRMDERLLEMTLMEGRYHQVKRMVAAAGNRVEALARVAVGGLLLPADLAPGGWRWLAATDLELIEGAQRP